MNTRRVDPLLKTVKQFRFNLRFWIYRSVFLLALFLIPIPGHAVLNCACTPHASDQDSEKNESKTPPAPIQNQVRSPGTQAKPDGVASENKQTDHIIVDRMPNKDGWDIANFWLTVGLLVIGFITFAVVWYQAVKTKEAAQAANLTAQVMMNTERALVDATLTSPTAHTDPQTAAEEVGFGNTTNDWYGVSLINHGKTVARILSCEIWRGCFLKDAGLGTFTFFERLTRERLLTASKPEIIGNIDVFKFFSVSDFAKIRRSEKIGVFRIDVEYRDIVRENTGDPYKSSIFFSVGQDDEIKRLHEHDRYS